MDSPTPNKRPPCTAVATPDRVNPPPRFGSCCFGSESLSRSEKWDASLPGKYKLLCEFFDSMINSIRLLRLKRMQPTFTKICHNIESLTERRFTALHLAQLKRIVPEVITVKKIRVQDEKTKCMKEEFLVLLETDSVEVDQNKQGNSIYSHLKEMFHSRIVTFYATHPEGDEVPEGELPHMFYMKNEPDSTTKETSDSIALSQVSPSFKRRFSSRACNESVPHKFSVKSSSCLLKTPVKDTSFTDVVNGSSSNIKGTPSEAVSTPSKLMVYTPALHPPKRSLMSPDNHNELPTKSAKRRSLTFDEHHYEIDDQPIRVRDDNDVQSYSVSKDVLKSYSLMDKGRKNLKEHDSVVFQTAKRQKLIASVPILFDMICLLFQSMGRSVITKQELIHKIIAGYLDIVDRGELEEQLKLLQEIAPEYLSEVPGLSGDNTLLRLNKVSCLDSIRAKLLEAKRDIERVC